MDRGRTLRQAPAERLGFQEVAIESAATPVAAQGWCKKGDADIGSPGTCRFQEVPDVRVMTSIAQRTLPRSGPRKSSEKAPGGDGWESNPPGTAQHRPTDGFEGRRTRVQRRLSTSIPSSAERQKYRSC